MRHLKRTALFLIGLLMGYLTACLWWRRKNRLDATIKLIGRRAILRVNGGIVSLRIQSKSDIPSLATSADRIRVALVATRYPRGIDYRISNLEYVGEGLYKLTLAPITDWDKAATHRLFRFQDQNTVVCREVQALRLYPLAGGGLPLEFRPLQVRNILELTGGAGDAAGHQ